MQIPACCMLISCSTAPKEPAEWAYCPKIAKQTFKNLHKFKFKKNKICEFFMNFKTESHEFSNYVDGML